MFISLGVNISMMRYRNQILIGITVTLLLVAAGFIVWAETPYKPEQKALKSLESTNVVRVKLDKDLFFIPRDSSSGVGVIIYPGGRVDPRAYAPLAHGIAGEGYLTVIIDMPLNLAVFDYDAALDILPRYPEVDLWVVGGHSLGGSMAARLVHRNPGVFEGLFLWASYPASSDDLKGQNITVCTIYGSEDGLTSQGDIENSLDLLPEETIVKNIEGGNHAQFGSYGPQNGDNEAMITEEEQHEQILVAMIELLNAVS
ncbi:alpha/beta hydrolase [Candidatus Bathyarchaeota archaeon]|nr:alpha/beta hydrolase [Candidatus Bathyarchaeota archaeon]